MTSNKSAIVALVTLTTDTDRGPAWLRAIFTLSHLIAIVYLAWYVFRGPDVVERKDDDR